MTTSSKFTLPPYIFRGERHNVLLQYAGALRARGFDEANILDALLKANQKRCEQPLADRKVQSLAAWIGKKPAGTTRKRDAEEVA